MNIRKQFYELGYTLQNNNKAYIAKNEKTNHEVVGFNLEKMLKYILSSRI